MSSEATTPLRVLLVEDNPDDAELILHALRRGGYDPGFERVETAEGLRDALGRGSWDLVIADYKLPAFSGPKAFVLTREERAELPFVLVSGTVGEETAAEAMRQGVDDYLMKNNLTRLPGAVERVLKAAEERQQRKRAQEAVRHRQAILSAVGLTAERLLLADDWRAEIEELLEQLGQAAEVDRSYLFANRVSDGPQPAFQAVWTAPGVEPCSESPGLGNHDLAAVGLEAWKRAFHEGRPVSGHTRDFDPRERSHLERSGVASIALVPIAVDGQWWGTIGFEVCRGERDWSGGEIEALEIAADTLGAAIQRLEVKASLQRQLERLDALRTIDRAITGSLDLHLTLSVVLDQATSNLGIDAASVLLLDPITQRLELTAGRGFRHPYSRSIHLRLGEGHAGRVALERRAVHVLDLLETPASSRFRDFVMQEAFVCYYALPLIAKNQVKGVLETFHRGPIELSEEWRDFAATLAGQAAIAIDNAQLFADLTRSNNELRMAYETTLEGWSRALDLRDDETHGHTERVATLAVRLSREMGMRDEELVHLRRGALLHDIGKMGIPDAILLKPGPLTEKEWEIMRQHPVYAYELLSPIPFLRPALDIPHCHHERWDGHGYPRGLKGEEIPLAARVFAVVDAWDALTWDRPYRPAMSADRARKIIREGAGSHFDPRVVEAFFRLDLSQVPDLSATTGVP